MRALSFLLHTALQTCSAACLQVRKLLAHSHTQFDLAFYLEYLAKWPEYCLVAEGPGRQVMGYIVGKVEGQGENWHGHVTAVTVAPDFRCAETGNGLLRGYKQACRLVIWAGVLQTLQAPGRCRQVCASAVVYKLCPCCRRSFELLPQPALNLTRPSAGAGGRAWPGGSWTCLRR